MKGQWKGKSIEYQPGRLIAALKRDASAAAARRLVEQLGGTVDYAGADGVLDVIVPERTTLETALKLSERQDVFRFVDPLIIMERRKSY